MAPYICGDESPFKARYASYLAGQEVRKDINQLKADALKKVEDALKDVGNPQSSTPKPQQFKVGIVGAGCAGLYSALLLKSIGIDYEILESSDRAGGRVMTHYFTEPEPDQISHDYYDVGAMRFPKIPTMDRTFDLFQRMGVNKKLIPYYMKGPGQPTRYNDITVFASKDPHTTPKEPVDKDPFHVSTIHGGPVPYENVVDPDVITEDAYGRFRSKIKTALKSLEIDKKDDGPLKRAWEYLMRHDRFSLRDYLSFVEGQDPETIHWLETLESATNWFNEAFTENVLESLAFAYLDPGEEPSPPGPNPIVGKDGKPLVNGDWYCVEGGTEELIKALKLEFPDKILYNKRVTKMVLRRLLTQGVAPPLENNDYIEVTVNGEEQPRKYQAVINTTTLAALQKMDLTKMELRYPLKAAIRSLHYDTSSKVGMKFKKAWWTDPKGLGIKQGGLGKTDMPLRVCVYPSYNTEDEGEAVLLCSYTWGQDSERVAAFINKDSPNGEADLKDLLIYNLARLHSTKEDDFQNMLKLIQENYITHHAFDWSKDPHASGAFALFSPGQFTQHYPSLVQPASESRFYIVGEAASAHHAWIVGALDSAMRGVCTMLERFNFCDERNKLVKEFGAAHEMNKDTLHTQIALGLLEPEDQPKAPVVGVVPGGATSTATGALVGGLADLVLQAKSEGVQA